MNTFLCQMIFMTENPKVRIEKCEAPQQSNGYNCGLYVLLFADALSKDNNECINSHDTKGTEYNQQSLTHIFSGVGRGEEKIRADTH